MSVDLEPQAERRGAAARLDDRAVGRAHLSATLVLTITLALGCCLLLVAGIVWVVHPPGGRLGVVVSGQDQSAKTTLYLVCFAVVVPCSLIVVPRLADALAARYDTPALDLLAGALAASLAASLVAARFLGLVGVGDGVEVVFATTAIWWAATVAVLVRVLGAEPWAPLRRYRDRAGVAASLAGLLVLAVLLCVTDLRSVDVAALALSAVVATAALVAFAAPGRVRRPPSLGPRAGSALELVFIVVLLLAAVNMVMFEPSAGLPNSFFPPGIIQFHQDFLLAPANQLLGGGALLVNVPVSQYGVGFIYFLAGWFHIVPIGYGTYGLIDGIVTGLFYATGYALLRVAGASRVLAIGVVSLAVVTFLYHLYYAVGSLPQQGSLRFGLPIAVVLAATVAARWPHRARLARAGALIALGLAAVWSVEMLAYTLFTYLALLALELWMRPENRRGWLLRQIAMAVGACLAAHLILAVWTLAATGSLPDWGQYLAYVDALVLGGQKAGQISYGFASWSPGVAVGAACVASAVAVVLIARRAQASTGRRRALLTALTGTTAYAVALFSYTDNRSSTYLLPYVGLPVLLIAALWLVLLIRAGAPVRLRFGAASLAAATACLMLAAAWPTVSSRFSQSALARAYPGGGLPAALRRLEHPPPIDPRAPIGAQLLDRYANAKAALVLLVDLPDLGTEILIRSHRHNALFIGDPKADAFIDSSEWTGKLTREIAQLRPGRRLLTDTTGLRTIAALREHPASYAIDHPVGNFNPQLEWVLHQLDQRFRLVLIYRDKVGFAVIQLARRSG